MSREVDVLQRLKGPVVPINICFNTDGTVNFKAVGRYVEWLCDRKVPVLMLTYGSSEFSGLTDEELWELTAVVGEANAARSLFIAFGSQQRHGSSSSMLMPLVRMRLRSKLIHGFPKLALSCYGILTLLRTPPTYRFSCGMYSLPRSRWKSLSSWRGDLT